MCHADARDSTPVHATRFPGMRSVSESGHARAFWHCGLCKFQKGSEVLEQGDEGRLLTQFWAHTAHHGRFQHQNDVCRQMPQRLILRSLRYIQQQQGNAQKIKNSRRPFQPCSANDGTALTAGSQIDMQVHQQELQELSLLKGACMRRCWRCDRHTHTHRGVTTCQPRPVGHNCSKSHMNHDRYCDLQHDRAHPTIQRKSCQSIHLVGTWESRSRKPSESLHVSSSSTPPAPSFEAVCWEGACNAAQQTTQSAIGLSCRHKQ